MRNPDDLYLPRLHSLLEIPDFGFGVDWDLIMADAERVGQLLYYYENENLNDDEKNILMQLIIASYDAKLNDGKFDFEVEKRLFNILEKDLEIHKDIFEYWARLKNLEDNGWQVTPMLRKIWFNNVENKI